MEYISTSALKWVYREPFPIFYLVSWRSKPGKKQSRLAKSARALSSHAILWLTAIKIMLDGVTGEKNPPVTPYFRIGSLQVRQVACSAIRRHFVFQDRARQLYPYLAVSCASNERLGASLVSSLNTTNWLSRSRIKKHIKTHLQQHTRNLAWDTLKLQRYSRIFTKVAKSTWRFRVWFLISWNFCLFRYIDPKFNYV